MEILEDCWKGIFYSLDSLSDAKHTVSVHRAVKAYITTKPKHSREKEKKKRLFSAQLVAHEHYNCNEHRKCE